MWYASSGAINDLEGRSSTPNTRSGRVKGQEVTTIWVSLSLWKQKLASYLF